MAVNGAMLNADGSLALMQGEKVFTTSTNVKLSLESGGQAIRNVIMLLISSW